MLARILIPEQPLRRRSPRTTKIWNSHYSWRPSCQRDPSHRNEVHLTQADHVAGSLKRKEVMSLSRHKHSAET